MKNLTKLSDEQLVQLVCNQDQNLYAELIRRYEKKLFRYAAYLVGDEQLASDTVQEGFIKAYINLNSFNSKLKFSSWLYRIVHNQAITMIGKHKTHQPIDSAFEIESEINLEDDLITKELHNNLHHCIEQMPLLYKEPLVLFFLEEKNYEEISDILHVPIGTVGTRINRAKTLVKKICQKSK